MKPLFVVVLLALLGLAGWALYEAGRGNSFWQPASSAAAARPGKTGPAPLVNAGLRKCRRGADVLYTGEACPPGSREDAVTGGGVTVVPAIKTAQPAPPAGPAAGKAPLRELLLPADGVDLKDRQMEKVIGK